MNKMVGKAIFTQPNKYSNLVLAEQWVDFNYCRLIATVKVGLVDAEKPLQVGEVLYRDAANPAAPFLRCQAGVALPTNVTVCICVEDNVGDAIYLNTPQTSGWGSAPNTGYGKKNIDWSAGSTDEVTCAVIFRGDCLIREDALVFGTYGEADKANLTKLTGSLNARDMRFTRGMKGTHQEIKPYSM